MRALAELTGSGSQERREQLIRTQRDLQLGVG